MNTKQKLEVLFKVHEKEIKAAEKAEQVERDERTALANEHALLVAQLPNRYPNEANEKAYEILAKKKGAK